ncbi:alpha-amylase family glycosyl hydrolase [Bacteroides togonis]|uniref:alpha-amylase family glycosyl hydrolase n=1 Tax=Bacteroides togonis TaxID=1917883 RepID=UPI00094B6BF8|nr:alpha-amylase family glycosyl hydrolase [Bacteroides togonis]
MKKSLSFFLFCMLLSFFYACSDSNDPIPEPTPEPEPEPTEEWMILTATPDTWDNQKRADISYQLLVYSFADSDGDGCGDFNGVTSKLDYLQQMGVGAIWLSPIHPAMSYHGYDVTDYTTVNPQYGTMADFERLVTEAHQRNIKVYLDYVMNHTGKEHPWFVSAKASPDSEYRNYYVFSQDPATDIAAGNIPMIATEGAAGYNAGEWFSTTSADDEMTGCYKFVLDWADAAHPTLTVTQAEKPDADNPDASTAGAKYLYYGEEVCKKFYDRGNGIYDLTVDFASAWGFLIRTSNTTWDGGTKYGASSKSSKIKLGEPFALDNKTAADILFESMNLWYYHSHFYTDWFADLNYGKVDAVATNPTYLAMVDAAKDWVDKGVDGLRLDAVKHIYHNATSDENPRFLNTFYHDMNTYYKQTGKTDDFYMVGEVLSEHNEVAPYYAGLPALFEFSFWYRLEWAINNATGCYFAKDIMSYQQEYASYRSDYIEATKLSNHDEDRTASKLGKSADKCKLAAAVLLTAAGSPYIYYGEELGLYGTKDKGDEYVRGPMLWGDSYTTSYTDKVDAGVASAVKPVVDQQADESSLLNTYISFARLRNTYPALAEGAMSRHAVYNETNETYKSLAAWYMTKDEEKMLILHNFGGADIQFPLTDDVEKAVAVSGSAEQAIEEEQTLVKLGAYSSVVFKLK